MSDSSEKDSFNTTHGKQVNGKFYTYKQLEGQSWGSTLKDGAWYIFLIGLVIFAILCFYVVDYKKGTQKDVIDRIGSISNNFTMLGIVNGSVEAAEELKEIVRATFLANSGKTEELKEWVANKTGTFYSEIKSTIGTAINGQKSFMDQIIHLPVHIKNLIYGFYQKYIQGDNATQTQAFDHKVQEMVEKVVRTVETRTINQDNVIEVETIEAVITTTTALPTDATDVIVQ